MKIIKKAILIILLLLLVGGAVFIGNLLWFKPFNINHFYDRIFMEFALDDPELVTGLGIPVLSDMYNDQLTDISPSFNEQQNEKTRSSLETLKSYDRKNQSDEELMNTDILQWFLETTVDGMEFDYHNYPVNQMSGIQVGLPNLMQTSHNIIDEEDAEAYIKRLNAFPTKFDQLLEGLRIRENMGVIPPDFIIDITLSGMTDFVQHEPRKHSLFTNLEEKLVELEGLDPEERDEYLTACEEAIQNSVYPAWQSVIDLYQDWKDRLATSDAGVWKLPDGDRFYAYQVRNHTTTSLTPEEIHQIGLSEVARIKKEMWDILISQGYTDTTRTLGEYITQLNGEERFRYENNDTGRKQCIEDYQKIIDDISGRLDGIFGLRPEDKVEVHRVPEFRQEGSAGAYYQPPALDGSRPGIFYANLRDMNEVVKFGMKTLAYHEAVPGHHFQISIQRNLKGVPIFRTILPFTAFSEGWALYSEMVAFEQGFYDNDPFGNLGRLQAEMFRAVRLVVDSGIHYKRWTREQAIEYMFENTGMPRTEVVTEIERYIVMPGQALAYKIGMMKIIEFREKAKEAMGDSFNLGEFHDVVLGSGAVPLNILEKIVENWVVEKLVGLK